MKAILIFSSSLMSLMSCFQSTTLENNTNEKDENTNQTISDGYLTIKCPCKLEAQSQNISHKSTWSCYSKDSVSFYSIQIEDFKKLLSPYDNSSLVMDDVQQQFLSRLNNIKATTTNYHESYLYGFPGFTYTQLDEYFLFTKSFVFATGNYIYTLSIITDSTHINNLFDLFVSSFTMNYSSHNHNYIIEIPKGFYIDTETVGSNVDLKLRDQAGNTIVVVVKKLRPEERITITELKEISNDLWEQTLQMPNVKIKQKGDIYINKQEGMSLYYTSKHDFEDDNSFYMNYFFVVEDKLYVVTARANEFNIHSIQREFLRALSSFDIK